MRKYLADRTGRIEASGIRRAFALAATVKDAINLSIGRPDFDVPEPLKEEAIRAIRAGHNKYSQTAGHELLKRKIAQHIQHEFGWERPAVLVTIGVSRALLLPFLAPIDPAEVMACSSKNNQY
jgi:aspartate aminotransferase